MLARIVLDTNVLVSGLLSESGAPGVILDLVRDGELKLVCDERILAEYRDVLGRSELHLDSRRADEILDYFDDEAWIVTVTPWPFSMPDPDDAIFLSVAQASGSTVVTGNARHFPPDKRGGVTVMSPREFLDALVRK